MYNQASIYKGGGVYKMGEASALPDNYEKPKRFAVVGDAVYADANGNVHIIVGSTINTSTIPSGWEFVGVVALREGSKATILYNSESLTIKWASMWLFKVNGLKLDGTDTFVLQQGPVTGSTLVEIGTFTASSAATDLDTLVAELDTWLRANTTAEGAIEDYNWHAEKHVDKDGVESCFIVVDNFVNQTRYSPIMSSTSGATADIYMWDWVGFDTNYSNLKRKDGVVTTFAVVNKERVKQYNTSVGSPTDSLTTTGVFNEADFNATTIVKGYYGTYDNYLDNIGPDEEATTEAYAVFKGKGKEVADVLANIVFPNLSGTDTNVFTAEAWAESLKAHSTATVEGLNASDFYVPSIDEYYKILSSMKVDGADAINSSIVKAGGSAFVQNRIRYVPARYTNSGTWLAYSSGIFDNLSLSMSTTNLTFRALAIAKLDL